MYAQIVQDKMSKCDDMLNEIRESMEAEQIMIMADELTRVRRRHTNLSEKISKLCERVRRAAQLRDLYWSRRVSLEACLDDCRRQMSSLDSNVDDDNKVKQLEAS